ncbi:MAG: dihydroorotate dehydrogenase electron transfer subunit [Christensenellales bacterium]|jgi:dihydroorotate dehydrogenase electron transfer subunit
MKQGFYQIRENEKIARDIFRMVVEGDTSGITAPGQFVNIKIDGLFLRRPLSVCDWDPERITLIYKVVGQGTKKLRQMEKGDALHMLTGLGNGYKLDAAMERPLIIGGGVGIPPLYALARALLQKGLIPSVVLGYNCAEDAFLIEDFRKLGANVHTACVDGSFGVSGFVTDVLDRINPPADYYFACGPEPMLKAVYDAVDAPGQLSFEERMGCGFGACMGCTCKAKYGYKRICYDGPVLMKEEIIW